MDIPVYENLFDEILFDEIEIDCSINEEILADFNLEDSLDISREDLDEVLTQLNNEELSNTKESSNNEDYIKISCKEDNILKCNSLNIIYKNQIFKNISIEKLYKFSKLIMEFMILRESLIDINRTYTCDLTGLMPDESKQQLLNHYYTLNKNKLFNL